MLIVADVLRWSVDTLLAVATLGCGYLLFASFLSFRFRARGVRPETQPVPSQTAIVHWSFEGSGADSCWGGLFFFAAVIEDLPHQLGTQFTVHVTINHYRRGESTGPDTGYRL